MIEKEECPLRVLAGKTAEFALCRGKDCAWYAGKGCAVEDLTKTLTIIFYKLAEEVKDVK